MAEISESRPPSGVYQLPYLPGHMERDQIYVPRVSDPFSASPFSPGGMMTNRNKRRLSADPLFNQPKVDIGIRGNSDSKAKKQAWKGNSNNTYANSGIDLGGIGI